MTTQLHATIMLWSVSTDPARQRREEWTNRHYADWLDEPDGHWQEGKLIDRLRDSLNDLINPRCRDDALLYEGNQVVGIKPECLSDFREWCERYGFDAGGL